MKSVLHVGMGHGPYDTRIFQKECVSLKKAGYDVTYMTLGSDGDHENSVSQDVKIHLLQGCKNNIRMIHFFKRMRKQSEIQRKYKAEIKRINADIVHIHENSLRFLIPWLKKNNKIVIYDCHEEDIGRRYDYFLKYGKVVAFGAKVYGRIVETKAWNEVDAVIAAAPHIAENVKKFSKQKNIVVICNYPIVEGSQEYLVKWEKRNNNIAFAGGVNISAWNHLTVLDALEFCENVNYDLCGTMDVLTKKELTGHKQYKRVNYLGVISHKEALQMVAKDKIGIALCKYRSNDGGKRGTLGVIKIFEMMMLGLPIICTDFVLWKQIIDEFSCGICVAPDDVKAVAHAINYLMSNQKVAKKMGENGRRAVLEKYNWETDEGKLLELYKNFK